MGAAHPTKHPDTVLYSLTTTRIKDRLVRHKTERLASSLYLIQPISSISNVFARSPYL